MSYKSPSQRFKEELIDLCLRWGLVVDIETMNGGGYLRLKSLYGPHEDEYLEALRNMQLEQ